jgi:putative flippase GtrA
MAEVSRFLAVGGVAFLVDIGLFNLLLSGPGHVLEDKVLTAKVLATSVAVLVSWLGNRLWTFGDRRTQDRGRELLVFAVVNVTGLLVQLGTVALSHYVLALHSTLADNIAAVLGIALGTVLRYLGYRRWVFTGDVLTGDEAQPAR